MLGLAALFLQALVHQLGTWLQRHLDKGVVEVGRLAEAAVALDHVGPCALPQHQQVARVADRRVVQPDRDVQQLDRPLAGDAGRHLDQGTVGHQRAVERGEQVAPLRHLVELAPQRLGHRAQAAAEARHHDAVRHHRGRTERAHQVTVDEHQAQGVAVLEQQLLDVGQLDRVERGLRRRPVGGLVEERQGGVAPGLLAPVRQGHADGGLGGAFAHGREPVTAGGLAADLLASYTQDFMQVRGHFSHPAHAASSCPVSQA